MLGERLRVDLALVCACALARGSSGTAAAMATSAAPQQDEAKQWRHAAAFALMAGPGARMACALEGGGAHEAAAHGRNRATMCARQREREGTEADACAKSNFQSKLDLVQTLPLNAQQI
jgi:hypothetical protein